MVTPSVDVPPNQARHRSSLALHFSSAAGIVGVKTVNRRVLFGSPRIEQSRFEYRIKANNLAEWPNGKIMSVNPSDARFMAHHLHKRPVDLGCTTISGEGDDSRAY